MVRFQYIWRVLLLNGHNSGSGANDSARVPVEHILNSAEAESFTLTGVFLEQPPWIDYDYIY
jgi:hypothetical protein